MSTESHDSGFTSELARLQSEKVRFLQSRGLDEQSAEETVSRAVIRLLKVETPIRHLGAYFHQIVVREHIDLVRRLDRERRFSHLLHDSDLHADEQLHWFEYRETINLLRSLRGVSPLAVVLAERRWVFGWTTEDLMEASGLSRDAIDQHISRVRRAARRARDEGKL